MTVNFCNITGYLKLLWSWINVNIILVTLFFSVSISIILNAYVLGYYISPDSAQYMREAITLLSGNGFNHGALAGVDSFFSHYAIGYSVFIALVTLIFNTNVYLSSKILTIIIIAIIHILFYKRFKNNAWLFCLITLNYQFISVIFRYTWSEQLFILGLIWLAFSTYDVIVKQKPHYLNYVSLALAVIFLFSTRYVGGFAIGVIGVLILLFIYKFIKTHNKEYLKKTIFTIGSGAISSIFILIYLINNYINTGHIMYSIPSINPVGIIDFGKAVIYAEIEQMHYVFQMFATPSMKMAFVLWILFTVILLMYIIKNKQNIKHILLPLTFITVGIIYLIAMSYPCFKQGPVELGRYLFPSTILFTLGFISLILTSDRFKSLVSYINKSKLRYVLSIIICFVVLFTPVYSITTQIYSSEFEIAYSEMETNYLSEYESIPTHSAVLWIDDSFVIYWYNYLRPDIAIINPSGSYDVLMSQANKYDHIFVNTDVMRDKLYNSNYDPSIVEYFSKYIDCNEKYIQIK